MPSRKLLTRLAVDSRMRLSASKRQPTVYEVVVRRRHGEFLLDRDGATGAAAVEECFTMALEVARILGCGADRGRGHFRSICIKKIESPYPASNCRRTGPRAARGDGACGVPIIT
jgi:hypothetical protein